MWASDPHSDDPQGWKTYTFVHFPTGDDQIWLTNLDKRATAAFESVSVLAGPTHLMTAPKPEASQRSAVIQLTNIDWVDSFSSDVSKRTSFTDCDPATIRLYKLWIASDRLRDYTLAIGMNGVMLPANAGGRTWFETATMFPRRDISPVDRHCLAIFLRLMESSRLHVFVGLQTSTLLSGPEQAIRMQPTLVNALTRTHRGSSDQYNPLHPRVQQSLALLVAELDQQCREYSCFAGVVLRCDAASHLRPLREASEDPAMWAMFARSSGNVSSPAQLRAWVQQEGRAAFSTWLREASRQAYERIGAAASNQPVLLVMQPEASASDQAEVGQSTIQSSTASWQGEGTSFLPVQAFRYGPPHVLARQAALQQQLSSVETPMSEGTSTVALLGEELNSDPHEPVLVRDQVLSDISRIIDRVDPSIVFVELPSVGGRLDEELANALRAFSALPAENMLRIEPIDPSSQTVHVRWGTKDGHLCVSMISLAPWPSEVELETSAPIEWASRDDADPTASRVSIEQISAKRARVVVGAGQLVVLQSKNPATGATVRLWSSRVRGGSEAVDQIKRKVTLIVERIGILSEFESSDALSNGGFEQSGGMGLVGWLHAQHPPGCVRVDDKEFLEGAHSVLLTTDDASTSRTWIVSETIDPPRSGRLAVSLACRGELKTDNSVHRLRVSIEATRDGEPIRYSSEFDVPRNGQWSPRAVVLEADGVERDSVDSLRLTIDSLSGGRVWIDDVHLHDQFPTAKERAELQSQAFLAVQGLQRGNLTPSGRLLQNHWACFLLTLGPAPPAQQVMEAVEPVDETPGVAERIRSWLPRPLRF